MIEGMDPRYPTGKFVPDPQVTPHKRAELIATIASLPAELTAALATADLDKPYREGGWTTRQVVHHVADSHMNAFVRFRLALTEENPTVKPYDQAKWVQLADSKEDPAVSMLILTGLHHRWQIMLKSMSDADFARTMHHPEHGPITCDWLLQLYAWHGRHHVGHVKLTVR